MSARRKETFDGERGGFSLIELLLVLLIVGVLAQIVVPNYRVMTNKARAVDIMSRIDVIENAVRNYQGTNHSWPAEAPAGTRPPELDGGAYIDEDFSFVGQDYQLDWENLSIPGGLPGDPGTTRILGVAVVTDNDVLARAIVELFGTSGWFNVGNSYMYIIDRQ